jgi:glycine/D-amino acid oxidase-like deaminating enzyme
MDTADLVIIGGGIIGCATAYHLTARGIRPLLLERRGIATEASGANAGMVGASGGIPGKTLAHTKKSLELLTQDAEEFGDPVELVRAGRIMLACSAPEWAEVQEFAATRQREGVETHLYAGDDLRGLEPTLGLNVVGGAFVPGDGHVNPFLLTYAYAAGARRRGAVIQEGVEAIRLELSDDRITSVLTPAGRIATPHVIVAGGAWSRALVAPLGVALPVRPGRGQMLVTEARPPLTARALFTSMIGIRQDVRGHVLIGSSVEDVGYSREVTMPTLARFARLAIELMPDLTQVRIVRAWAGIRPMTPDGLPIIDTAPGVEGLILATGHSRSGISYAAVTGWLLSQLVTEGRTALPLDPFRLARFAPVVVEGMS